MTLLMGALFMSALLALAAIALSADDGPDGFLGA
jgi:hypothetical protein